MKKLFTLALAGALAATALTACGSKAQDNGAAAGSTGSKEDTVITIGATPSPHAQILEEAKKILAKEGYELDIRVYNDYVLPNTAVEDKELDANYFQHEPYLIDFNAERGTHLVSAAQIHYEPFGIYAGRSEDLSAIADGASIAVPNDSTNEARALLLLEAQGLITLKPDAGLAATVQDITANPKNLKIEELEAAQLPRVLKDVDFAVINGNYALGAGLSSTDAVAVEDGNSKALDFINVLVVREGNEDSAKIRALSAALTSDEIKAYIEKTFGTAVVPVF